MPYPEQIVAPMRAELTRLGVDELKSAADVDRVFAPGEHQSVLLVINSVCGCAAANARPAVALASQASARPDKMVTVFAGQDLEATERARSYMPGIAPSSPFIALFSDGDPVFILERRHIEGRTASAIATDLVSAFDYHSGRASDGADEPTPGMSRPADTPSTFRSIL